MSGELTTQEEPMTREELDAFSRKLESFTESLTPKERALLLQVLMRAGEDDPQDVEAHEMGRRSLAAAALALHMEWSKHRSPVQAGDPPRSELEQREPGANPGRKPSR